MSASAGISLLIFKNDFCAVMLIGALLNAVNGKVLKLILGQNRPNTSTKSSYGMPSSHANSLFYFVSFLSFAAYDKYGLRVAAMTFLLTFLYSYSVCYCRVHLRRDHTWLQVIVGATFGSLVGACAYLEALPSFTAHFQNKVDWKQVLTNIGYRGVPQAFIAFFLLRRVQKKLSRAVPSANKEMDSDEEGEDSEFDFDYMSDSAESQTSLSEKVSCCFHFFCDCCKCSEW